MMFSLLLALVAVPGAVQDAAPAVAVAPAAAGASRETAIKVKSVEAEYKYLRKHRLQAESQALVMGERGKAYDLITAIGPDGGKQEVWFDISSFYGKGFGF